MSIRRDWLMATTGITTVAQQVWLDRSDITVRMRNGETVYPAYEWLFGKMQYLWPLIKMENGRYGHHGPTWAHIAAHFAGVAPIPTAPVLEYYKLMGREG